MTAGSDKSSRPRARRFESTFKGEIFDGSKWVKMIIQDVSDNGFPLVCTKKFPQGEILNLWLLPAAGKFIKCTAEIRHSNDMGTGAKIISMDEKNRSAYDQYIQAMYSQHLGRLG